VTPSRALAPAGAGWVELRGVRVAYETFGAGEDTLVLLPPWTIIHSRFWKAQIPYLARHFRVVSFDARGNGPSDRPIRPEDYAVEVEAEHALAVLDHTGVERCLLVAHCGAAEVALSLGAGAPRVLLLALTIDAPELDGDLHELLGRLQRPLLVTHGDEDAIVPPDRGPAVAEATGTELRVFEAAGHCPHSRHPVRFNLIVREFAERVFARPPPPSAWRRALRRRKRALLISSPIGLGHAWRDVAIARRLRALEPELEIDWLAQDPVTRVLETCGERVHPASRLLANESRHIAAESR
jgi:pimeloyl-ACP methyl ester carboxylesterase